MTNPTECGTINTEREVSKIVNTPRKTPPRQSKKDLAENLVRIVRKHMESGLTVDEALEKLSIRQYDFLCDYKDGEYLDLLRPETAEEKAVRQQMAQADRKTREGGYNKKYPEPKKNIYMALVQLVQVMGGEVHPKAKENFRDLDFTLNGVHYRIVFSSPRT